MPSVGVCGSSSIPLDVSHRLQKGKSVPVCKKLYQVRRVEKRSQAGRQRFNSLRSLSPITPPDKRQAYLKRVAEIRPSERHWSRPSPAWGLAHWGVDVKMVQPNGIYLNALTTYAVTGMRWPLGNWRIPKHVPLWKFGRVQQPQPICFRAENATRSPPAAKPPCTGLSGEASTPPA